MTYPTDAADNAWQPLLADAGPDNAALNAWIDLVWKEGYPNPDKHFFNTPEYAPNLRALALSREWTDYDIFGLFDGRTLPGERPLMKLLIYALASEYYGDQAIRLWRNVVRQELGVLWDTASKITIAKLSDAPSWTVHRCIDMMVEHPALADSSGALTNLLAYVLRVKPPFDVNTLHERPSQLAWLCRFHNPVQDFAGRLIPATHIPEITERTSHMGGLWKALANVMQGTGTLPELHEALITEAPWTALQMANSTATSYKIDDLLARPDFDPRITTLMRIGRALGVADLIEWAKSQPNETLTGLKSALPADLGSSPQ
jgi:hypothetical protein